MTDVVAWMSALDQHSSGFLQGATTVCSLAIALFFLRFWHRSKDRLFIAFAVAFVIFAVSRAALAFHDGEETRTYIYLFRLAAFLAILWAVIDKNRSTAKPK